MDYGTAGYPEGKQSFYNFNGEDLSDYILPISPAARDSFESQLCQTFLRQLRQAYAGRMSVKVLSSIRYTSEAMIASEAHIAKILVDYGLRAPRAAFPKSFLDYADHSIKKQPNSKEAARYSCRELYEHWLNIGDYSGFSKAYSHATDTLSFM